MSLCCVPLYFSKPKRSSADGLHASVPPGAGVSSHSVARLSSGRDGVCRAACGHSNRGLGRYAAVCITVASSMWLQSCLWQCNCLAM